MIILLHLILILTVSSYHASRYGHSGLHFQPIPSALIYNTHYIYRFRFQKPILPPSLMSVSHDPSIKRPLDEILSVSSLVRPKRFLSHGLLPFIGWINQKLTGVATTSDLDDLKVQSKSLSVYIENIRQTLRSQGSIIHKLISDIDIIQNESQTLTSTINKLISRVDLISRNISDTISEIQTNIFNELDDVSREIIDLRTYSLYTRYSTDFKVGYSTCQSEKLPRTLVNDSLLSSSVATVKSQLRKTPFELSIPEDKMDWYYEFQLAFCSEDRLGLDILLAIPIRHSNEISNIEKLIPLPIRINGKNYEIPGFQSEYIMTSKGSIRILTSYTSNCVSQIYEDLSHCLVKPVRTEVVNPMSCLALTRFGSSVESYKDQCEVNVMRSQLPSWIQVNSSHWFYTGEKITLKFISLDSNKTLEMSAGGFESSTLVFFPCNYYLEGQSLLPGINLESCRESDHPATIHMISLFYLPYGKLLVPGNHFMTPFQFSSDLVPINATIPITNYTESLRLLDQQLEILKKPVPIIEWSSPYHSLWLYTTYAIGLISTGLIIICICKCRHSVKYGAVPLSIIHKTEATQLPAWVDISFDFTLFIIIVIGIGACYLTLRRILRKMSCHNVSTNHLKYSSGHHCDIVIMDPQVNIIIGLKNVPVPGYFISNGSQTGFAECTSGVLTVSGFDDLLLKSGKPIPINGVYLIPKGISFSYSGAVLRLPTLITV